MTHDEILDRALAKPGTFLDEPFGPGVVVVKVKAPSATKGRVFAQVFHLDGQPKVTLSCTPDAAEHYRAAFPGAVVRGYHCPPVQQPHNNTISLDGTVPDDVIADMIDEAYDVVVGKLPKYQQAELAGSKP